MRLRKVGWGLLDQVFSSASNIIAILACARVSTVHEFGAITLAFALVTAVLAVGRGFLGTPLTLLGNDNARLAREVRYALSTAIVTGFTFSVIGIVLAGHWSNATSVVILCAAIPGVLAQDICRFYAVSAGKAHLATMADGVWALGSVLLYGGTFYASLTPTYILGAWSTLGILSLLLIALPLRLWPKASGFLEWIRRDSEHRTKFATEAAFGATGSLVHVSLVTALMGAASTAALRGSATLFGPLSLLINSIPLAVVPELRRTLGETRDYWKRLVPAGIAMSALSLTVGMASFVVPTSFGDALLGDSWGVVSSILPITAVEYVGQSWLAVANTALRTGVRSGQILSLRVAQTTLTLVTVVTLASVTHNVHLIAAGMAINVIGVAVAASLLAYRRPTAYQRSRLK